MSDEVSYPGQEFRGSRAGRYGMGPIRPQRRGLSPDTRRLMMFSGGVVLVVGALAGIASFTGHHHGGVPVIAADPYPYRMKPADPGGLQIDAGESDVFSGDTDTADAKLAPTAEAPDPNAFRSAEQSLAAAAPTVAPAASPSIPPATAAAQPASQPQAEPSARTAVASEQATHPAPAAQARPATKPAAEVRTSPQPAPARATVLAAKPAPAAPAARAADRAAETAHKTMIQLAAVGSEDAAKAEWQRLLQRYPELARHQPAFSRTEHDGKTFWRVRAAGFADIAQARAFCEQVRGKGGGCSVADF